MLNFLKGDLYKLFQNLLHRIFAYFPHLFIYAVSYLHQYGIMNIYFILWTITQYYFILCCKEKMALVTIGSLG